MKAYRIETIETRVFRTVYEVDAESEEDVINMDADVWREGFVDERYS